jgi:hypothetical protein
MPSVLQRDLPERYTTELNRFDTDAGTVFDAVNVPTGRAAPPSRYSHRLPADVVQW